MTGRHVGFPVGDMASAKNYVEFLDAPRRFEKDPKSVAGKRTVMTPPHILPLLQEHERSDAAGEFVVPDRYGHQVRGNTIDQAFAPSPQPGRVTIACHDRRHTGQSLDAATGASLDMKSRLGHSPTAAAQRHLHAVEGRDAHIAEALSGLSPLPIRLRGPVSAHTVC